MPSADAIALRFVRLHRNIIILRDLIEGAEIVNRQGTGTSHPEYCIEVILNGGGKRRLPDHYGVDLGAAQKELSRIMDILNGTPQIDSIMLRARIEELDKPHGTI